MATSHHCPNCGRWHVASRHCERLEPMARYQRSDAALQSISDDAENLAIARYLLRSR
jgi:hypothetical protein